MNMIRFISLIITTVLTSGLLFGQAQALADSLKSLLENKTYTSNKEHLSIIDNLCDEYMAFDLPKAKEAAKTMLRLSKKFNEPDYTATSYESLGSIFYLQGLNDSSLIYLRKGLELRIKNKQEEKRYITKNNIANVYRTIGKYDSSISVYTEVLKYFENRKDKNKTAQVLANIGAVFYSAGNYDKSIDFTQKALIIQNETGDEISTAISLTNLMLSHYQKKNFYEAVMYGEKAKKLLKTQNYNYYAYVLLVLSSCYQEENNFAPAINSIKEAIEIYKVNNNVSGLVESYVSLSDYYIKLKQYNKAKEYGLEAYQIADTTNIELMESIYAVLKTSYIYLNHPENAAHYSALQIKNIKERNNEIWAHKIADAEAKYQSEKKEMQILKLKDEQQINELIIKRRNIIILSLAVVLALLSGISFLIYRNIRNRKLIVEKENEIHRQKINELEKDRIIIATQAALEGETAERRRISQDLHDGLGGMLSALKLKIAKMFNKNSIEDKNKEELNTALVMLDDSMTELRRSVNNLMPASLLKYGLNAALTDFCGSLELVEYHFFGTEKRINEKHEVTIYRIVNELVNNSVKHSGCSKIYVQLIQEPSRLAVVVNDNGKGFDLTRVEEKKGNGLNNIRSRVSLLNGKLDFISAPGKGCDVSIEFSI